MRRGYSIIELMIIIIVFPAVMLVVNGLFRTLARDIPRASRVVQENTTVLSVLGHIQQDVDAAKALPQSYAGYAADANMLLIELEGEMICYELAEGKVFRRNLTEASQDDAGDATVWSAPNARIQWRVWSKDGDGYAVEVKTHVKQKLRNRWLEKMAGSHLYFVGAL